MWDTGDLLPERREEYGAVVYRRGTFAWRSSVEEARCR